MVVNESLLAIHCFATFLHEDVVQVTYASLEASAVGIRVVRSCTPIRV